MNKFNKKLGLSVGMHKDVKNILLQYEWPGNIRELANIIERAFILCKTGLIEKKHLPESLFLASANISSPDDISLKNMEKTYLVKALEQNSWDCLKTARQLGIHKSTLYRKIKSLKISLPK